MILNRGFYALLIALFAPDWALAQEVFDPASSEIPQNQPSEILPANPKHCCSHGAGDPVAHVLDELHHAVEGNHEHEHHHGADARPFSARARDFFSNLTKRETWLQFSRKLGQTVVRPDHLAERLARSYYILVSKPDQVTHAKNLIWLFPLSHLTETIGGFALLGFGEDPLLRAVGGIIPIPGLDPLCFGVYAMYGNRSFRNAVTLTREFIENTVATYGVRPIARWMPGMEITLPSERVMEWLSDDRIDGIFEISRDGKWVRSQKGDLLWTWVDGKYGFFLKEIQWIGSEEVTQEIFLLTIEQQIRKFPETKLGRLSLPFGTGSGVLRAIRYVRDQTNSITSDLTRFWNDTEKQPLWLEAFSERTLRFVDYSVLVHGKRQIPNPFAPKSNCNDLLK